MYVPNKSLSFSLSLFARMQGTFAAVMGRHAKLLPTNGCSLELYIPFPLLLRTNKMHVAPIKCFVTFAAKNTRLNK